MEFYVKLDDINNDILYVLEKWNWTIAGIYWRNIGTHVTNYVLHKITK